MDNASPAKRSLEAAIRHHLAGRHDEAEAEYRGIIADDPALAAPKYWLAFMLQQTGRLEQACELMSESLRLDDTQAEWFYNYGILLDRLGRAAQAVQAFLDAIALDPQRYFCWTNLGSLYEKIGDPVRAEQSYLLAIHLDPDCPDAFYLASALYTEQQRFTEAKQFYCRGFVAGPVADKSRIRLSLAYYELGRTEEAIALIDDWLAQQPEHPVAQHLAVAYKGLPAPQRCSQAYVESSFDGFAASFELTLSKLNYAGPQALAAELQALDFSGIAVHTLDLGCGTGLNGAHLKSVSSRLEGIDLSQPMLDIARQKGVYDRLTKTEICDFLARSTDRYDLIGCIDTLIYFGALEEIIALAARNLKAGGWFIFTTEKLADDAAQCGYRLNISGRYSHRESYVRALLQANGFAPPHLRDLTLRMEAGMPIAGQMLRVRKL
jgi:predicted TPR repeat methyltransferase